MRSVHLFTSYVSSAPYLCQLACCSPFENKMRLRNRKIGCLACYTCAESVSVWKVFLALYHLLVPVSCRFQHSKRALPITRCVSSTIATTYYSTNWWRCHNIAKPGMNLWSHALTHNHLTRDIYLYFSDIDTITLSQYKTRHPRVTCVARLMLWSARP